MIEVDEAGADQQRGEEHEAKCLERRLRSPGCEKENPGEGFDEGIAKAVGSSAAAGPSAEYEPTEDGNVIVPFDRLAAGAGRAWAHYGFACGYSIDTYVEETSHDGAHEERDAWHEPGEFSFDKL